MSEKILGYLLLLLGLGIIFVSTLSAYRVLTKKEAPIQLFNFSGISLKPTQMLGSSLPPQLLSQIKGSESPIEILSPQILNDTSNIFVHLMFMGFFVSVGFKIASLGAMLVRPIVVKAKGIESVDVKP